MDRMERPDPTVLPDSAMVPEQNLIRPAPTHFTHELTTDQPFTWVGSQPTAPPDGTLPAGTEVVLLDEDGGVCQVVDGRGLRVWTSRAGLRSLAR